MERYSSREPFGFTMDVLGSKRIPTTVNTLAVTDSKCILTPLFITVEIFARVVPNLFAV